MKKRNQLKRPKSGNNLNINRNSKDLPIKNMDKKINKQKQKISQLKDNNSFCENKLKEFDHSKENLSKKGNNDLSNLSLNKNHKNNRHNSLPINKLNSDLNFKKDSSSRDNKYDILYQKYMNLLQDYKNLSNNTISTAEYTKVKSQYDEIKNQNNLLLKQINNKEDENETIKELTEQIETLREELILSQALVNSLRTELEQKNKNIQLQNYKEAENIKTTLKNNNILLSNILQENNELRQKALNNNYKNNDYNNKNSNKNEILLFNLKNNLDEYENKFDYFNDYINNIKNKITFVFNDLQNIINKYETKTNNFKDIKMEINNLNKIDRFNLDSNDDEKCLQKYMDLMKILLIDLENKNEVKNNIISLKKEKENNQRYNNVNNNFNKTINLLKELLDILNQNINGNGFIRLISDAINIIINLSNMYKTNNKQNQKGNNNINEKIYKMEKDFDYIKKLILNYKSETNRKKLTYTLSYNNNRMFNTINRNNYNFKYS